MTARRGRSRDAGGAGPADPVRLRDALPGATARLGVGDPVATGRLWAAWPDVVGPAIARRAQPTSLREGVLRVRADSPAWATEISYLADEIRRRADDVVGRGTVVEVRVWTGPPPDDASPARVDGEARASVPARSAETGARDPIEAMRRARAAWARRRRGRA